MIFWVDTQLYPDLAHWLARRFSIEAFAIRDVGLRVDRMSDLSDMKGYQNGRHIQLGRSA